MIKIEYEDNEFNPHAITVKDADAVKTMIEITSNGGKIAWVEKTK